MKKVVYTREGLWKFYYDKVQGICFFDPKQTMPMVLFKSGQQDFDLTSDEFGNLYLICQDHKNAIYLFYYDQKTWNKRCILESKSEIFYLKYFRLINIGGWINGFYLLKHETQTYLVHHVLNNDSEPIVFDAVPAQDFPYWLSTDSKDNILCFYVKNGNLGYRRYRWSTKQWEEFQLLHKLDQPVVSISGLLDWEDRIHLALCCGGDRHYTVLYVNQDGVQEISSGGIVPMGPVIFYYQELTILFELGGRILQSASPDLGGSFFKAKYFFPGSFSKMEIAGISSSVPLRNKTIIVNEIYGYGEGRVIFEPALIGEEVKRLDFGAVEKPREIRPELDTDFAQTSLAQEFSAPAPEMPAAESEQRPLPRKEQEKKEQSEMELLVQIAKKLNDLEARVSRLEEMRGQEFQSGEQA